MCHSLRGHSPLCEEGTVSSWSVRQQVLCVCTQEAEEQKPAPAEKPLPVYFLLQGPHVLGVHNNNGVEGAGSSWLLQLIISLRIQGQRTTGILHRAAELSGRASSLCSSFLSPFPLRPTLYHLLWSHITWPAMVPPPAPPSLIPYIVLMNQDE